MNLFDNIKMTLDHDKPLMSGATALKRAYIKDKYLSILMEREDFEKSVDLECPRWGEMAKDQMDAYQLVLDTLDKLLRETK